MINFCTLFDSNYLTRGLALYESLKKFSSGFNLYVVAFNEDCYQFLGNAHLPNLTPISLNDFEDEKLLKIKQSRSVAEYCWTCTPSVIAYCIKSFGLSSCTYVDADMIFYDDPQIILNEASNKSVIITEHRYTKDYDQSQTHGMYCVQFMYFKNDDNGLNALNWWRERCIEWCFARPEDGKFGDQKYLDDWPARFAAVHVMKNEGGGIAPWNVQQYKCYKKEGIIYLRNKKTGTDSPLVFFHFHGLKFFLNDVVSYAGTMYELDNDVKELVFKPYVDTLRTIKRKVFAFDNSLNVDGAREITPGKLKIFFRFLKELFAQFRTGKISFAQLLYVKINKHNHYCKLPADGEAN
jgi:hypothetical protein